MIVIRSQDKILIYKIQSLSYTSNDQVKYKTKNTIPYTLAPENEIIRYKSNQICTIATKKHYEILIKEMKKISN